MFESSCSLGANEKYMLIYIYNLTVTAAVGCIKHGCSAAADDNVELRMSDTSATRDYDFFFYRFVVLMAKFTLQKE